jgi:hypothetical protein
VSEPLYWWQLLGQIEWDGFACRLVWRPRAKVYQAKDVPEDVILRELRRRPGKWHTHWPTPEGQKPIMPTLGDVPELAKFPVKVLVAKLNSMARRKLISGGGTHDMRGDWHVVKS